VSAGCRPFILLRKSGDLLSAACRLIRSDPGVWLSDWLSNEVAARKVRVPQRWSESQFRRRYAPCSRSSSSARRVRPTMQSGFWQSIPAPPQRSCCHGRSGWSSHTQPSAQQQRTCGGLVSRRSRGPGISELCLRLFSQIELLGVRPSPRIAHHPRMTVEDALREIADCVAALQYLMDAAKPQELPDPQVFSGLADMLGTIAVTVQRIQDALSVDALAAEVAERRR